MQTTTDAAVSAPIKNPKKSIRDILREEAERGGYTVEELVGPRRTLRIVIVRQYAMWRARKETKRSFPEIGFVFRRDHTSIVHGYQKVEAMDPLQRGVYPPKAVAELSKPGPPPCGRPRAPMYYGKPCLRGHKPALRYVSNSACVACRIAAKRKSRAKKQLVAEEV